MTQEIFNDLPKDQIENICRQYHVIEVSVFGSALRDDFRPDSDIDLLVEFDPAAQIGFLTLIKLQREFSRLFSRAVDLVPKRGLKPAIRQAVLDRAKVIYAT